MELDETQRKAADIFNGPAMILAGPGSGKTSVMLSRILNLISRYHVPPESILAVTFSRSAAQEMQTRYRRMAEKYETSSGFSTGSSPSFGTFHSIFFHILNLSSPRQYKLIPEKQRVDFLRMQLSDLLQDGVDDFGLVRDAAGYISRCKNTGISEEDNPVFETVLHKYEAYLNSLQMIDFDDMILKCHELLSGDQKLLNKWQERFRYLLVDEFQDINLLQYKTIALLAGKRANLFAVGDDDQSIYRFRGADPSLMKQFIMDYPGARQITLNTNYRCPAPVLDAARSIIRMNRDRIKDSFSKPASPPTDSSGVRLIHFTFQADEASYIANEIKRLVNRGTSPESIAVLFRRNNDMAAFAEKLSLLNVPAAGGSTTRVLCEDPVFRDIIAYIRLSNDLSGRDTVKDTVRILNKPARGLSPDALRTSAGIFHTADVLDLLASYYKGSPVFLSAVRSFAGELSALKGLQPFAAFQYIVNVIKYDNYTGSGAEKFSGIFKKAASIQSLINQDINSDGSGAHGGGAGKVRLMTMHAAKGLEFDTVFLPQVTDNIIPGHHSDKDSLSEECRLLYVAVTRAANRLYISYTDTDHGKHVQPSRYIKSLLTDKNTKNCI